MDTQRLHYLLERHHTQTGSAAERAELEHWYQSFENRAAFTEGLSPKAQQWLEDRLLAGIEARLSKPDEDHPIIPLPVPAASRRSWLSGAYRIAAVFVGLLIVTALIYQYRRSSGESDNETQLIRLATAYGKTRSVTLPDGSTVILNGNSEIQYPKAWTNGQIREVALRGEAFFQVVHTQDHRRFKVRTANDFSVEVLGTQFTVSKRQRGTRVVLNEGRVQCNLENATGADTLLLKPGELVEFTEKPAHYSRRQVDPSLYSVWTEQKLVFRNTSLREITSMLNETYGFTVSVEKPDLLNRRISGSVPTTNLAVLLQGIAETCRLKIRQQDRHIYLTDNTP